MATKELSSPAAAYVCPPLVIEVMSTNWRDDYLIKLVEHRALGIREYWIVDYAALGGRFYIGNPKQPAVGIYTLIDGKYEVRQFRRSKQIISATFPEPCADGSTGVSGRKVAIPKITYRASLLQCQSVVPLL